MGYPFKINERLNRSDGGNVRQKENRASGSADVHQKKPQSTYSHGKRLSPVSIVTQLSHHATISKEARTTVNSFVSEIAVKWPRLWRGTHLLNRHIENVVLLPLAIISGRWWAILAD